MSAIGTRESMDFKSTGDLDVLLESSMDHMDKLYNKLPSIDGTLPIQNEHSKILDVTF